MWEQGLDGGAFLQGQSLLVSLESVQIIKNVSLICGNSVMIFFMWSGEEVELRGRKFQWPSSEGVARWC